MSGIVSTGGEGELLERPGRRAWIKVDRDEIVVVEFELDARTAGAGPHFHRLHVDSFYVVEGELELTVGDETVRAGPRALVAAPPTVVHSFRNDSAAPVRFVNTHTPGVRFAEYLRRMDAGEDFDLTEYDVWGLER